MHIRMAYPKMRMGPAVMPGPGDAYAKISISRTSAKVSEFPLAVATMLTL